MANRRQDSSTTTTKDCDPTYTDFPTVSLVVVNYNQWQIMCHFLIVIAQQAATLNGSLWVKRIVSGMDIQNLFRD